MAFDWMKPKENQDFVKTLSTRSIEAGLAEIEQRAKLLKNLQFSRDLAVRRITDNLKWEFELSAVPSTLLKNVTVIVNRVFDIKKKG